MSALAVAQASLRRLLRDRMALFFILVLPIVVIVVIGATVRGFSTFRVGVVELGHDSATSQVVSGLRHSGDIKVTTYATVADLRKAIARGEEDTGVIVPQGLAASEERGAAVQIPVLAEQANSTQQAAATAVIAVLQRIGSTFQAAGFATAHGSGTFEHNLALAGRLQPKVAGVGIRETVANRSQSTLPGGFSYSAPTELVLFVFLSALTAGGAIIESRRLGMFERIAAAPVRSRDVIAGESLTYLAIALGQSALIVAIGALVFGVSWGNPLAAVALVVVWALVGASAGILAGTLFRTPERASAIGPVIGIALAMLGGCMWPLSIVSSTMREIGHLTPQAWAVDAWTSLLARHGNIATIAVDLLVLCGFAAVIFAVATNRFRRSLEP